MVNKILKNIVENTKSLQSSENTEELIEKWFGKAELAVEGIIRRIKQPGVAIQYLSALLCGSLRR